MPDLDERFRALERASAPDLWHEASTRRPRAQPPPPIGRRVTAAVVAFVVAGAAIAGAAIVFRRTTPRPAEPVENGRIAFSGFDGTTWQILSVEPDGSGLTTLTTMSEHELAAEPAWSPDGGRIAFVVQRLQVDGGTGRSDIWVMDADGRNGHPITDGPGSSWAPSWSPDGTRIAFMRSSEGEREQVWVMGADGSDAEVFAPCGPPECVSDTSPAWSPDGGRIAFVRSSGAGAVIPMSIMVWPVDGTGDTSSIPIEGATWADELAWSPDGLELAFTRSFEDGTRFGLAVVDADGTDLRPLTHPPSAQSAAWSPDGRQIAFMATVPETGRVTLFVMNADATGVHEIPGLEADAASPSWQPVHVGPEPIDSPSPIPLTGEPRVTAEIPLIDRESNDSIGGVAVGAGSAWIGVHREGSGSVLRIDLATNEIVAEIPVREMPGRKRIVATDDAVWVASFGLIQRIDPATNAVVASVELPERSISAIAADATTLWALTIADEAGEPTGILVRIDTRTNGVAAEIPLGSQIAGYEDEVLVGAGSVWVLGVRWFEKQDAEYGSDLIRVDPTTNAVEARIPVGGFHMVMGLDEVWVRFPADGVFDTSERWLWTRVDVRTNEPSEPFRFEDEGLRLVTADALWSVGYDEHGYVRVTRFDPQTLQVDAQSDPIRSLFHDAAIDARSRSIWVPAVWNLVRVDVL